MTPGTANYGACRRGDTIAARTITVTQDAVPLDLTTVDIQSDFTLRDKRTQLRIGSGITVTDAVNGVFRVDEFSLEFSGVWQYDLQLVYADGTVRTLLVGSIEIVEDITP
ncbi:MAG: hypothetical protein AAFO86_07555 [Pseudomonadota bacterium]